jgi:hypothetical protein
MCKCARYYVMLLCVAVYRCTVRNVMRGVATVKVKGCSSSPGQIANTLKIKTPLMFYLKKVMYLEEGSISQADEHSDLPETALRANRCHCVSECVCTQRKNWPISDVCCIC